MFKAKETKDACVQWIKNWFNDNGKGCNAVIGISGGKDSSIVAALCVEALGNDRVIGVIMPNHEQSDIGDAYALCDYLDIYHTVVNIGHPVDAIRNDLNSKYIIGRKLGTKRSLQMSTQAKENLPPRIRMAVLYAVSQSVNGRVANTCNLSEDYIGYSTRWGDSVGDFSPLANLTVTEVKAIGKELGLPDNLIEKTPADGLCGLSDEDNIGFTYDVLDRYIREGVCEDAETKAKIDARHEKNLFKLQPMPTFKL